MSELVGQAVAGYPLQKLLSKGGYCETYQAASSGAPLSLKVLRADVRANKNFGASILKGWESARAVNHANLVTVFSTGNDNAVGTYALQELVSGKPLREFIIGGAKIAWRDCLVLAEQLFSALKALHGGKILHGEIWPGGILLTQDQDLKLDRGAGFIHLDCPPAEIIQGPALGYMAPERIEGSPISIESDIYSAGACLYFILAGQDAFPGDNIAVIAKGVLERKPPPLNVLREDLPPEAEAFIGRLMAKDPTQRYASVDDIVADINRLKNGQPMAALKGGRPAAPARPKISPPPPPFGARPASSGGPVPPPATGAPRPGSRAAAGAVPGSQSGTPLGVQPKRGTGLLSAVQSGATGAGASGTRIVFGRLDTHVKSTIPQSDVEKRGDDYYRQGQLPLALNTWKDAFANATPHAALKMKIELAERELKKETYNIAFDEAKHRINSGDFRGAIARAREAMMSAETEQQRQDAIRIEGDAIKAAKEAEAQNSKKLIIGGVGALVVLFIIYKLFIAGGSSHNEKGGAAEPGDKLIKVDKTVVVSPGGRADVFVVGNGAIVRRPENWVVHGSEMQAVNAENVVLATMRSSSLGQGATIPSKRQEIANIVHPEKTTLDDSEAAAMVDGLYQISEQGFRWVENGEPEIHYYYLVAGPSETLYQVEFSGKESTFSADLMAQAKQIVQSWTYNK